MRIVCALAAMPGVAGSKGGFFCGECGNEVQLAPSGRAYLAVNRCRLLCLVCFLAKQKTRCELHLLPGSIEELAAYVAQQRRN